MEHFESLELGILTILVTSVVPLVYYIFLNKAIYDIQGQKKIDAIFFTISTLLLCCLFYKVSLDVGSYTTEDVKLLGAHFIPLIVNMLAIAYNRRSKKPYEMALQRGGVSTKPSKPKVKKPKKQITRMSWNDLVINKDLESELKAVVKLLSDSKAASKYGISVPKGILLSGPPGTGKTTIARVMACEANLNFFAMEKDKIVSKYVGESEKNMAAFFDAVRAQAPAIIFIDEVDALGRGRAENVSEHGQNLLNHLLQEIDGIYESKGIYIIAATNRSDIVDSALKRSGRLTKEIVVGLPDYESRYRLFNLFLSKLPLKQSIDIQALAEHSEGISGADIKAICDQAGVNAFQRESGSRNRDYKVDVQDLKKAFTEILGGRVSNS